MVERVSDNLWRILFVIVMGLLATKEISLPNMDGAELNLK
jgi:hypothetical protein